MAGCEGKGPRHEANTSREPQQKWRPCHPQQRWRRSRKACVKVKCDGMPSQPEGQADGQEEEQGLRRQLVAQNPHQTNPQVVP